MSSDVLAIQKPLESGKSTMGLKRCMSGVTTVDPQAPGYSVHSFTPWFFSSSAGIESTPLSASSLMRPHNDFVSPTGVQSHVHHAWYDQ